MMVDPARRDSRVTVCRRLTNCVDPEICARLAHDAALRQEGVAGMNAGLADRLGMRRTPGVAAHVDHDGWLQMDISIVAREGVDLAHVGSRVQDAAIAAVREASYLPIGRVNVNVTQKGQPHESGTTLRAD